MFELDVLEEQKFVVVRCIYPEMYWIEATVLQKHVFFLNQGNFITTSHYADVVEERMIAKKCGYPLCNNQLNQVDK